MILWLYMNDMRSGPFLERRALPSPDFDKPTGNEGRYRFATCVSLEMVAPEGLQMSCEEYKTDTVHLVLKIDEYTDSCKSNF